MKPKDRIKVLNSTKQSSIRKFDSPPGPKVGREGDLGVAVIPKKGLHLFYKLGGKWHGVRLKNVFNTEADDRKIIIPSNSLNPKNGELFFENNDIKVKLDDDNSFTIGQAITKINRDVADGNPVFQIGSSDTENFQIITNYNGGAKGIDKVQFITATGSSAANKGAYEFYVDGTNAVSDLKLMIDDGGIHVYNPITANEIQTDSGDLTLDSGADIDLQAEGGDITFKGGSDAALATINSSGLTINNISSGDGSGENFLVEESGIIKKRTAAQTLNDIGAMPDSGDITIAGTLSITDTSSPPLKVAYDANHFATFDMDTNGVLEIECTDGGSAESKLQLKNGGTTGDQYLVWGNSSETARITSNGAQNLVLNTNEGTDSGYIELQDATNGDISIIPNGTGTVILGVSTGSVQFATNTFLDANGNALFGTAVASSAVNNIELGNAATGNAATLKATGTDTNVPLTITTKGTGAVTVDSGSNIELNADGGIVNIKDDSASMASISQGRIELYPTDANDKLRINTSTNGVTVISTNDNSGGNNADLTLDAAGDIVLDSANGNFLAKNNGTEFSVANSAYAGMIIGYQMIGEQAGHTTEVLTTSFAVTDANHRVKFVAPPSGKVEIEVQIYRNSISSNKFLYFGLSDNATYNSIGNTYEQLVNYADETDDIVLTHKWVVSVTAGTTYEYWLGAKTSSTNLYLAWGGTGSNRFPDFIMKATALPAATSEFAVYD